MTVTFEPYCSVIKLKWKFEVLTMITVKIPALWNVKSCSLGRVHLRSRYSVQYMSEKARSHKEKRTVVTTEVG